ncbi:MAG TPA: hypothetical protein PKE65_02585 [Rhizobiaceae bacterium]|nr:hypothetical protein [Rhizobiaceae bacterium]
MIAILAWIDRLPWAVVVVVCLTLGLAPFFPEPHVLEKLKMLAAGALSQPIDIFDLAMHGAPFVVAGIKLAIPRG